MCNLTNSGGGGQTLGYAYLPGLQGGNQSWKDGLVVDYKYFGTIGNASSSSDGRTPTHEIGHYLGLSHTFCEDGTGGCCDNDNSFWGGSVDDTPATDGVYFGSVNSNTNNNSCNDLSYGFSSDLLDMDENYMSYASDTWMFSQGQVDVMLGTLNTVGWQGGRKDLWQNSTVTVNCSGTVSLNQYQSNNLSIYPNPSDGDIFINSPNRVITLSVYNVFGEEVISNTRINNSILNLNQLSNGIYFIKINESQAVITKKIILSK